MQETHRYSWAMIRLTKLSGATSSHRSKRSGRAGGFAAIRLEIEQRPLYFVSIQPSTKETNDFNFWS